jgi:hypothetical protein
MCKFWNSMSGICTSMRAGSDVPFAERKGLHRRGSGFQAWEEKRAEANIAQRMVQIPLMESYDLHVWCLSFHRKASTGIYNFIRYYKKKLSWNED